MNQIDLYGCRSRPLASYLASLAVLRLVSEQRDPDARGWWQSGRFALRTRLTEDEVLSFFVDEYVPTPIIAPWNGGSGFYPKPINKTGFDPLREAQADRLRDYRTAIRSAERTLEELQGDETSVRPDKELLLLSLRASQPDRVVEWLDAVLLLASDSLAFPPLLGTGGNDGNLEFTNNFMQRIVELIDPTNGAAHGASRPWLRAALFGEASPGLGSAAIGQYSPLSAGGPNASAGFTGADPTNPWSYVLLIEGAVTFSAAATRRSEASSARLSYPFTVRSSGSGSGGLDFSDDATSRAEMWMPLWTRPATYREVSRVFSEGRLTVGARQARDGLEAARALASLGVDRGIESFERFVFAQRNGRAFLATPQGQIRVSRRPEADLIASLDRDRWLDRVRRMGRASTSAASIRQEVRALEDALIAMSHHGGAAAVQAALVAIGRIHRLVGRSKGLREHLAPVRLLPADWSTRADDGSFEYRVARSLASVGGSSTPIRWNLFGIETDRRKRLGWSPESNEWVDHLGRLEDLLVAILARRSLWLRNGSQSPRCLHGATGIDLVDWVALLEGSGRTERIRDLLFGLGLVEVRRPVPAKYQNHDHQIAMPPLGAAALKLFLLPGKHWADRTSGEAGNDHSTGEGGTGEITEPRDEDPLDAARRIPDLLGRLGTYPTTKRWRSVTEDAFRWLEIALGTKLPDGKAWAPTSEVARRWLAFLLVPLNHRAARRLAKRLGLVARPDTPDS